MNTTKTKGTALYHPVNIGNICLSGNLFLAPIAGYSDRSFRSICCDCGCNFTYTEMVSSEALVRDNKKTEKLLRRAQNEQQYAVQIFGSTPETMGLAARYVMNNSKPSVIDINCGCPVQKIIKTGSGASLTRNPEQLGRIVKFVKSAIENEAEITQISTRPALTIKIRSGWDQNNLSWKEAALAAIENGADAITLHPRTRAQGYEGKADWTILAQLVELIHGQIPVFGSGDIFSPEDAKAMLEQTHCDAIMFARGAMGNPFIFEQTRQYLLHGTYSEVSPSQRIKTGLKELELLIIDKGEKIACREMRKRFCAYTKGIQGASEIRKDIVLSETFDNYVKILEPYIE
ncbi:MAG: tRNA dihydrouridine synthase DusB [Treponema sp. CETP13]|nr:MAG: tRNA dihydrouridine synthase DusB [Treponema sp. CETP13]